MGVIVNTVAVIIGGLLGLLLQRGLAPRFNEIVMSGIGLCILVLGVQDAIKASNPILLIICLLVGGLIGEALQIEENVNKFSKWLQHTLAKGNSESKFAEGFSSLIMLCCVGAMAIVGSLRSGLVGDDTMLYTKSILDFVTAIVLASSNGIGVIFGAGAILVYQGSILLTAQFLAPFLSEAVIAAIGYVGGVLLVALGINILRPIHLKVMNYIPAIFLPILFVPFFG